MTLRVINSRRTRATAAVVSATTGLAILAGGLPAQAGTRTTAAPASAGTRADWTFPAAQTGISDIAKSIRADVAYQQGFTGKGVGVALIDTGVAPVPGLTSGNIVNGPDRTGPVAGEPGPWPAAQGRVRSRDPYGGHHRRA